ncbi:diacylglycerol kinase family protein [Flavobacteriaceae bacterium F08102]|nr:diacylglycerol kinase family protein [Flavobacteriaceae bacterium F08102]
MIKPEDGFIVGRIKSVKFALKGLWMLLTTEHSIMVQMVMAMLITVLGFLMDISRFEWIAQLLAIGLVLTAEALNTAIEKIADVVQPDFDPKIGMVKDIAAGGVTFAAIIAAIIGLIIYVPKFM